MIAPPIVSIHRPDSDTVHVDLALPDDHAAFAGHFPGRPVLPGVVQVDWAVNLAETHLASGMSAALDYQVKFRRMVVAGMVVSLELRIDRAGGVLIFTYRSDGDVVSSGRIRLPRG